MPLAFAETMAGTLTDAHGGAHHTAFTVQARGEGGGYFRLSGTAFSAGLLDSTPCVGALTIGFGFIRYRVRMPGPGGDWLLLGQKSPSPRAAVRSMTVLPIVLHDPAGAERARGNLHFALRDLPAFALSWLSR